MISPSGMWEKEYGCLCAGFLKCFGNELAAVLSAFMNNVGALALLMPVAIEAAGRPLREIGCILGEADAQVIAC